MTLLDDAQARLAAADEQLARARKLQITVGAVISACGLIWAIVAATRRQASPAVPSADGRFNPT